MDRILLLKIGLITAPFIILCIYSFINVVKVTLKLNKEEKKMITKRKIMKRDDSNIYDLKTRRKWCDYMRSLLN